ncbi:hypothetical protein Y88_2569 [Novosphingobium nitrogenifigens DSM 19370]|uniref:Ancillary SecYEG translocon subunit/Cell division coordinator CpoB TPR domain-containing protein n=1 Tax=Novosphingobium nitrogenifigens DSM 19370 TaxID=983920 RepID=F1Z6X5_9SPHN|nr:hypothetical protein Y88_2569 [Novosphingobium nitrogenifigens DSM 19370]
MEVPPSIRSESATLALFSKNSTPPANRQAERRAAQEQVFLREVDDALREDSTLALFKRYGGPAGMAIVLVLAGVGGWLAWTNHVATLTGQRGEQMAIALDQVEAGRYDAARTSLAQIAATGGAGFRAASQLVTGGIALDQHKSADAAKAFGAVAADGSAPQVYRDLATVREVAAQFDTMQPQQVVDRLKPLAVPGNPWFGSAGEMLGVAYMKMGKNDQAASLFAAIAKDKSVPDSLRGRIRQLAVHLGVDMGEDPAAQAAGQ